MPAIIGTLFAGMARSYNLWMEFGWQGQLTAES